MQLNIIRRIVHICPTRWQLPYRQNHVIVTPRMPPCHWTVLRERQNYSYAAAAMGHHGNNSIRQCGCGGIKNLDECEWWCNRRNVSDNAIRARRSVTGFQIESVSGRPFIVGHRVYVVSTSSIDVDFFSVSRTAHFRLSTGLTNRLLSTQWRILRGSRRHGVDWGGHDHPTFVRRCSWD